ncbi:MerR family transcriptional regulator [Gordonia westfalica]|uniref:MerR family transcriptional regulator n=1 Tax=Gordonia westfalica TaxID=158898 RepID=UPI0035C78E1E
MSCSNSASRAARLSIGQLAIRTGLSVSAIRYYEAKGLVRSERSATNSRSFTPVMALQLALAHLARNAGLPIAEIAGIFDAYLPSEESYAAGIASAAQVIRRRIAERHSELVVLRAAVTACASCSRPQPPCDSCPLVATTQPTNHDR